MSLVQLILDNIEDYPFIIRFKTLYRYQMQMRTLQDIEDYPFIIRFKTKQKEIAAEWGVSLILKIIHL